MTEEKDNHFEVIVIGGGAIGLASAYHLEKRGCKTLVLEQYNFKNQLGSSAGVSRQYRIPYPEDYMVKMAMDAQPFWDELQSRTSRKLLDKVGTLWFGDPSVHSTEGNIAEAEQALKSQNIPYTTLTSREIEEQYHFKNLPDTYTGLFQADGASIDFKATIETLYEAAVQSRCVTLREKSPVTEIRQAGKLFEVITPEESFICEKLIIAPGPFVDNVVNLLNFKIEATYWNMSSAYFKKTDPKIQYPTWFVFQNAVGENGNQFYGFPGVIWDHPEYIRVAPDFVINPLSDPAERTLVANPQELAYTSEWIKNHMTGLDPVPHFTSTCLIALSKIANKELLIDFAPSYVPNHKNIVVYATGWAAKFTPFLGQILTQLALDGHSEFDITPFQLGYRFFKAI
ncbi:sarcosine oxidase [Dyadobacter koreensis]|uniref:Sarcosine oxidase n=1 Tax=Dyadobacter koreensis TaxID=408657 RepID=A0A1H6R008_9BACT|nr:FAD-dependent oxidoreductase [Dyadobacter koreensis]SEI44542.1 sarcosine oxidase [Dyadobacter koreensis]